MAPARRKERKHEEEGPARRRGQHESLDSAYKFGGERELHKKKQRTHFAAELGSADAHFSAVQHQLDQQLLMNVT